MQRFPIQYFRSSHFKSALAATATASSLVVVSRQSNNDGDDDEDDYNIQQQRNQQSSLLETPSSLRKVIGVILPDKLFPELNIPLLSTMVNGNGNIMSGGGAEQYCQCDQAAKPSTRQIASIRKFRTVRELGRSATHAKLETKYIWDKNKVLGVGAYGSVFLATDKSNKEPVALKEIPKTLTDSLNFQQEMTAMLYIKKHGGHPNLCTLHEHFDYPEHYYIILDYIGGGELFDHLIKNGAYSELDASRLVREVASALSFLHGIGVVHADLKPENILLTTSRRGDSVIKLCDFGCTQILQKLDEDEEPYPPAFGAPTPAYCPPETILKEVPIEPPMDMWGLGVILFIMLTGAHPYDIDGDATDEIIEKRITDPNYKIPLDDKSITGHLSSSAKDLIAKLMDRDPNKRLTAMEMLQHPWVRGETAATDVMHGSDERLSKYRVFQTKLQAHFFQNAIHWSDDGDDADTKRGGRNSLLLRSFKSLDEKKKGYLTSKEILGSDKKGGPQVNLSDFNNLLSSNIKHQHFPAGHVIYQEGDPGNHMYIIDAGNIEVTTKDGSKAIRGPGEFFGEGALLHPGRTRSATVTCKTPVHALEIDREDFDKYIASNDTGLLLTLKEKDKIRKRNRAKTVLRSQKDLKIVERNEGETFFAIGEPGKSVFVLESGKVDVVIDGKQIFSAYPGNIFGEFSLFSGLPRNCTAVCKDPLGCVAKEMEAKKFKKIMDGSPHVKDALRELQLRREFKKAVVVRLGKEFPYENPREAFEAADMNGMGILDRESVADLMRELKNDYCDNEIDEIIRTVNLTDSGFVTYDEFKKVFIGNIKTAGSM